MPASRAGPRLRQEISSRGPGLHKFGRKLGYGPNYPGGREPKGRERERPTPKFRAGRSPRGAGDGGARANKPGGLSARLISRAPRGPPGPRLLYDDRLYRFVRHGARGRLPGPALSGPARGTIRLLVARTLPGVGRRVIGEIGEVEEVGKLVVLEVCGRIGTGF